MLHECKYAHVCHSCFEAHRDQTHKQLATPATPTTPKTHKPKYQAHQNPPPTPQEFGHVGNSASKWPNFFFLNGICNGFSIVDTDVDIANLPSASAPNSQSSQLLHTEHCLEANITEELCSGNYQLCNAQPTIISPISAVPKLNGGLRLIHDLSHPGTYGVNAYASKDTSRFMKPSGWFSPADLWLLSTWNRHICQCILGLWSTILLA